jgi:hypothetical protein
MMMLPPSDQIQREVAILSQYEREDDVLFYACAMAGISVFELRGRGLNCRLSNRRAHAMLLLGLHGIPRHIIQAMCSTTWVLLIRIDRAWRRDGAETAFQMARGQRRPANSDHSQTMEMAA